MTATSHTITGALIGASLHNPIAIPLAFLSHFILDAVPHFGESNHIGKRFKLILAVDALLASIFLASILFVQPSHWGIILASAMVAPLPDAMWLPYWLKELKGRPKGALGPIARLHKKIQWSETNQGFIVEILWVCIVLFLFVHII